LRYKRRLLWHKRPTLNCGLPAARMPGPNATGTVLSIENLSDVPLYAARPSRQVPPKRKAASWIAVGIVHLAIANLLIFSEDWKDIVRSGSSSTVTTLDLRGATDRLPAPEVRMAVPEAPAGVPPEVFIDPLVVPRTLPDVIHPRAEAGISDGDLLGAVGRDVACIAGNYENLTPAQRSRCARIPWLGAKLPDGSIVLRPPETNPLFAPPPQEFRVSGADGQRRQMETAGSDPCPLLLNTPCFNRIPGRN